MQTPVQKKCPKCKTVKFSIGFYNTVSRPDGLSSVCKDCKRAGTRARYEATKAANAADEIPEFEITMEDPAIEAVFAEPDPVAAAYAQRDAERDKRDLKREHRALLEENETLKRKLGAVTQMSAPPALTVITRGSDSGGDSVACVLASDMHFEEPVEANKVHGLNEYNLEIARTRCAHFFRNTLKLTDMMARETGITTLWMGWLGDFITNYIHDELKQTNLLAPGAAAHFAIGLLTSGLEFLLKESKYKFEIDCVPGNHGRMTQKMQIANATETSIETLMYHVIADRYADNPRVHFRVADSKMLYRKFFENFTMRICHGDDVKFGGGIGGITIPIRKKIAAWDKGIKADLTVMGHFHQRIDGGDFIVNGSLIGFNEFAQAIGASPEEAQQAFFLINARNGGVKSIVAPVWVDAAHKAEAEPLTTLLKP